LTPTHLAVMGRLALTEAVSVADAYSALLDHALAAARVSPPGGGLTVIVTVRAGPVLSLP